MNIQSIIEDLAGKADEILVDAPNRKEAKLAFADALSARYPKLNGVDRQKVITGVMGILEEEEFFASAGSRDSWSEGEDDEE